MNRPPFGLRSVSPLHQDPLAGTGERVPPQMFDVYCRNDKQKALLNPRRLVAVEMFDAT